MTDFLPGDLVNHVNHPESLGVVVAVQEPVKDVTCIVYILWNRSRLVKIDNLAMLLDILKV